MPLFEVSQGELVPFRRLKGGEGIYETEIEDLLWANVEEFTGETLFPVRRQAKLPFGGIPDVLALEKSGRVVIFEIKRDVDRRQLAQCLEYAGWARTTSLDELAALYHGGEEAFWTDWQDFTESSTPVVVNQRSTSSLSPVFRSRLYGPPCTKMPQAGGSSTSKAIMSLRSQRPIPRTSRGHG
jgi:hypothetical protein